jgi:hypothetical protein
MNAYDLKLSSYPAIGRKISGFATCHFGPVTAYGFTKHKCFGLLPKWVPPGSNLLVSAGEIDCRHYLLQEKFFNSNGIRSVARECVARYLIGLVSLKKQGFNVGALGPLHTPLAMPHMQPMGTIEQRFEMVLAFNGYLRGACHANGLLYATLGNKVLRKEKYYFAWDGVHLSARALPLIQGWEHLFDGFQKA